VADLEPRVESKAKPSLGRRLGALMVILNPAADSSADSSAP
jgi:hypothetical protein